ncbi:MAG: cupin domain-containing protein [Kangiellaceae bacterium]
MFNQKKINCKTIFTSMLIASISFSTLAQQNPAVDPRIKSTQLERFSLVKQVPAMKGYDFRARKIVVPAGAVINKHSHINRPGMVYVESGTIIEYRGVQSRTLVKGDTLIEDASTVHSYKNISDADCVLIAFDLPVAKPPVAK